MKTGINETPSGQAGALSRNSAYVELNVSAGVELNVQGELTINAMRANNSTNFSGHVTGSNYAQLHLNEDSSIIVSDGGVLNAIGFIYGNGKVEAQSGARVYESMFIKQFRGGTVTNNHYKNIFPFDQFTLNNIEVDLVINKGVKYYAKALTYIGTLKSYIPADVYLIGDQSGSLIKITSGQVVKSYNVETGRVSLNIDGQMSLETTTIKIAVSITSIEATNAGKEMPFDGSWQFNISSGSRLTVNSGVKLLPGAI